MRLKHGVPKVDLWPIMTRVAIQKPKSFASCATDRASVVSFTSGADGHLDIECKLFLASMSDVIRVARVICILFMAYVHVHLFPHDAYQQTLYFTIAETVLVDLFGRSSVPLLSVVSGILMIHYFGKRTYLQAIGQRSVSLVWPMVVWNTVALGCYVYLSGDVYSWQQIPGRLLAFTGDGYWTHLTFLRDLFAICVIAPLLIRLIQLYGAVTLAGVLLLCVLCDLRPFLLRDSLLFYFTVGLYVGFYRLKTPFPTDFLAFLSFCGMALVTLISIVNAMDQSRFVFLSDNQFDLLVRRPLCAIVFWHVAAFVVKSKGITEFISERVEPAIFLMFLSHVLVSNILGSVFFRFETFHSPILYFLVWLSMPFASLFAAMCAIRVLDRCPKSVSILVQGK